MRVQTIDRLLARGERTAPALFERELTASFAELDAMADAVAARLIGQGLKPGERAAIYAQKSIAMVAALFGVWRAGGVAVPVNPVLRAGQVAHILSDSGSKLLLTQPARAATLAEAGALGTARALDLDVMGEGAAGPNPRGPDDLAALLYTSGSTGRPKGVMLSHANVWLAAESVATYLNLAADDRALAVLPLSFDAGLSVMTSGFYAGGSAALLDYLVARDVVRAVERYGITTLSGVPPLFVQLIGALGATRSSPARGGGPPHAVDGFVPGQPLDHASRGPPPHCGEDWPGLRRITITGGRMPVRVTERLRALFPQAKLHLMYGLTEAFRSLSLDPALVDTHPRSVGRAIPHARVAILRADGSEAADDEPGELVHSGPLVAIGYWRDAEATARRFRPAPDGRGLAVWSGDTLRRDRQGLHYFVGRDDEMIKTSGLRVSPTDIEEAAHATGAVTEAAAFGVADERLGQTILLVAVGQGEDAAERLAHGLARTLPLYMRPARMEWREALPRSPNGKIDRAALRAEVGG